MHPKVIYVIRRLLEIDRDAKRMGFGPIESKLARLLIRRLIKSGDLKIPYSPYGKRCVLELYRNQLSWDSFQLILAILKNQHKKLEVYSVSAHYQMTA